MEIYKPAYCSTRTEPRLLGPRSRAPQAAFRMAARFSVQTPDAANISSAIVMQDGAVTHAFDMDQRLVGMSFTAGSGSLTVTAPPNANIAPPGYYMLFLLNSSGVPSVATFIQLSASAPDFSLSAPPSESVNSGNSVSSSIMVSGMNGFNSPVSLACSGLPANATCSFNPSSVTPGSSAVTSTLTISAGAGTQAGTYNLSITGTGGLIIHNAAVVLTVQTGNTPDFVISTPALSPPTISAGASTGANVSITPANGFNTSVTLTCSGLPADASCSFNPASIANGSGASTLNVATKSTTPAGTYPISVTGSSGSLSHVTMLTLTVTQASGSFALSTPSPATATVNVGASASATITVTPSGGFSGVVNLSCTIATSASPAPTCSPASVSVTGGPAQVSLTVATTAAHTARRSTRGVFYAMFVPLAGLTLLGAGFAQRRKNVVSLLLVSLLLSGLLFLVACGGGSSTASGGGTLVGGTPAGTYTVTINATSGSITAQSTTFTLTVQ